jgi:hypothetical protein
LEVSVIVVFGVINIRLIVALVSVIIASGSNETNTGLSVGFIFAGIVPETFGLASAIG